MWLSILLLLFIFAIAFFQTIQGLFSALIMLVLTLCCAGLAMGTHEWVAIHYLSKWKGDFAYALALALTFGLPLLLLRVMFDQTIKRAPLLPSMVDRIGGALCGVITALIIGGMTALALQLVPFGYTVLSYTPSPAVPDKATKEDGSSRDKPVDLAQAENELFLTPDRFAAAVGVMLSEGVFSGKRSLADGNPDLVQRYGWANFTHTENPRYAPPGSVRILKVDDKVQYVYKYTQAYREVAEKYEAVSPAAGERFVAVRVALEDKARNRSKRHMFTLRQFRLVGRDDSRAWKQFYPIAIQSPTETQNDKHISDRFYSPDYYHVVDDLFEPLQVKDSADVVTLDNEVEFVYRLPRDFEPLFLEYKLGARVAMPAPGGEDGAGGLGGGASRNAAPPPVPPRDKAASAAPPPSGTAPPVGRGGRVRKFTTNQGRSKFGDDLPMALKKYNQFNNAEVTGGRLAGGHLVSVVSEQEGGAMPEVARFDVPADKRLLHLNVSNLQAQSTYGKAIAKAIATASNFLVHDEDGRQYRIVGKYAVTDVGGEQVCEIQYFPEQIGSIGGIGNFNRIRDADLKGDYELVLLFLVDPGAKIKYFSTGGSADRRDDLSAENLVAPK